MIIIRFISGSMTTTVAIQKVDKTKSAPKYGEKCYDKEGNKD